MQEIAHEIARLQRSYAMLSYGTAAAWVVLTAYLLTLVSRQRKLQRETARLREMVEQGK